MSQIFSDQTNIYLKGLLDQYNNVPYGINVIVNNLPNGENNIVFDPTTQEIFVPNWDTPGKYLTCFTFATEAFDLMMKLARQHPKEIKSVAYIAGTDKYGDGHCSLAISPVHDLKLQTFKDYNKPNSYFDWYLNQSMMFDLCYHEYLPFQETEFKCSKLIYFTRAMRVNPDKLEVLDDNSFSYIGIANGFGYGFILDKAKNSVQLLFRNGSQQFVIGSHTDYLKMVRLCPWLDCYEVNNTLEHLWNMRLGTNLGSRASDNSRWYGLFGSH